MSEILIRGFSFPEDCSKCPLRKVSQMREDLCVISGCRVPNYPERPSGCYLHEIKPHGRLIDADKLKQVMDDATENDKDKPFYKMMYSYVIQVLAESPTVLEATE